MSISELRPIKDKSGRNATACDVAIHSKFFIKVDRIELFRDFLLTIIFEALETKYNVCVDQTSWTILKKKSMGELVSHRIQNRDVKKVIDTYPGGGNKSLIQELDDSSSGGKKPKPLIEEIISNGGGAQSQRKPLEYRLMVINTEVVAEFHLPLVESLSELFLVIGVDCIRLAAVKRGYYVNEYIRHCIDPNRARAEFQENKKVRKIGEGVCLDFYVIWFFFSDFTYHYSNC